LGTYWLGKRCENGGITRVLSSNAKGGFLVLNLKGGRGFGAGDSAVAKAGKHAKVFNNGHAQNSIHGHVIAKTKGNLEWIPIMIGVGCLVSVDSSQLTTLAS
jgi:hypothetical protein